MDAQIEQDLRILEEIELNPDLTQADLAARLGVAVGSVNWYIKRMINKGYIKVRKMQRRRLKYLITPQGLAVKAHLTREFMKASMRIYRQTRVQAQEYLNEIQAAGFQGVNVKGDSDLAEICYLTCLEQGIKIADSQVEQYPTLLAKGREIHLFWPGDQEVADREKAEVK